jgi:hypothetical protein
VTLTRLGATLAVLLPIVAALAPTLSAVDLAYHLRAGGQILAGGGIPRVDNGDRCGLQRVRHPRHWIRRITTFPCDAIGRALGTSEFGCSASA